MPRRNAHATTKIVSVVPSTQDGDERQVEDEEKREEKEQNEEREREKEKTSSA
jgi:hypothetical protein